MNNKVLALAILVVAGLGAASIVVVGGYSGQQTQGAEGQASYGNYYNENQYGWAPQAPGYAPVAPQQPASSAGLSSVGMRYTGVQSTPSTGLTSRSSGYTPVQPQQPTYSGGLSSIADRYTGVQSAPSTGLTSAPLAISIKVNKALWIAVPSSAPTLNSTMEEGIISKAMSSNVPSIDVTDIVQNNINQNQRKTTNSIAWSITPGDSMFGDPQYGTAKTLVVEFEVAGPQGSSTYEFTVPEYQTGSVSFGAAQAQLLSHQQAQQANLF